MPSDRELVACNEQHEMEYILRKYFKRSTNDNIEKMTGLCKSFKNNDQYKPHNRDNFYKYLDQEKALDDME